MEKGRGCLWEGGLFGLGPGARAPGLHSHHAFQLTLALDGGRVRFRDEATDWQDYRGVLIAPEHPHAYDGTGGLVLMLLLDPESRAGRWLQNSVRAPFTPVRDELIARHEQALLAAWHAPFDADRTRAVLEAVVRDACTGPPPRGELDGRVRHAIARVRAQGGERLTLEQIAAEVFLSPSRFAHLFAEQTGLGFRRYQLWRRLCAATLRIGAGDSFTAAAHTAGFADSAHLTRTYKQMFGLTPTDLTSAVEIYSMRPPFEDDATAAA